jgi:hypothetical protein
MAIHRHVLIAEDRDPAGDFVVVPDRVRIERSLTYTIVFFNTTASKLRLTFKPMGTADPIDILPDEDGSITVTSAGRKKISYEIATVAASGALSPVTFIAGDPEIIVE